MDYVLHPQTRAEVDAYLQSPSHALLLEGPTGSGKAATARYLTAQVLGLLEADLDNYSFYLHIAPVDNVIPIAAIRDMRQFTNLKTIGERAIRRALIIEDAHRMTFEAQNALLKLLEEPPTDTVFTAASDEVLLPTIYSRAQHISLKPPAKDLVMNHFANQGHTSVAVERAYNLSEGHMGLMHALLAKDSEHPLKASIEEAKQLVSASTFERMAAVERLSKQKDRIPELLYALQRVYRAVLVQASDGGNMTQVKRAHAALKRLSDTSELLKYSPNAKLLLSDLLLNL
jgi:DNA polymerase-3 subunit delta'